MKKVIVLMGVLLSIALDTHAARYNMPFSTPSIFGYKRSERKKIPTKRPVPHASRIEIKPVEVDMSEGALPREHVHSAEESYGIAAAEPRSHQWPQPDRPVSWPHSIESENEEKEEKENAELQATVKIFVQELIGSAVQNVAIAAHPQPEKEEEEIKEHHDRPAGHSPRLEHATRKGIAAVIHALNAQTPRAKQEALSEANQAIDHTVQHIIESDSESTPDACSPRSVSPIAAPATRRDLDPTSNCSVDSLADDNNSSDNPPRGRSPKRPAPLIIESDDEQPLKKLKPIYSPRNNHRLFDNDSVTPHGSNLSPMPSSDRDSDGQSNNATPDNASVSSLSSGEQQEIDRILAQEQERPLNPLLQQLIHNANTRILNTPASSQQVADNRKAAQPLPQNNAPLPPLAEPTSPLVLSCVQLLQTIPPKLASTSPATPSPQQSKSRAPLSHAMPPVLAASTSPVKPSPQQSKSPAPLPEAMPPAQVKTAPAQQSPKQRVSDDTSVRTTPPIILAKKCRAPRKKTQPHQRGHQRIACQKAPKAKRQTQQTLPPAPPLEQKIIPVPLPLIMPLEPEKQPEQPIIEPSNQDIEQQDTSINPDLESHWTTPEKITILATLTIGALCAVYHKHVVGIWHKLKLLFERDKKGTQSMKSQKNIAPSHTTT